MSVLGKVEFMKSAADRGLDRGVKGAGDVVQGVRSRDLSKFLRGVRDIGGGFIDSMNPCMFTVIISDLRKIAPGVRIRMGKKTRISWEEE